MSISEEYVQFVLGQLECLGQITARKMFGGAGLYLDDKMFAIVANDVLYFKVDNTNRDDYEKVGMGPFQPFYNKQQTMSYYEVPIDVLENIEELKVWAEKAYAVVLDFKTSKKRKHK